MGTRCLITGATGLLGTNLVPLLLDEGYDVLSPTSLELDITNEDNVVKYFQTNNFDLVIHMAAYTDVKKAESEYIKCIDVNVIGTYNIFKESVKRDIKFIYISTDAVFDGKKGRYKTSDAMNPVSKYAKTKTSAELIVRTYDNSLVIRTSFFGETFPYDKAFTDQWSSKDYIDIIAPKILLEINLNKTGVSHVYSTRRTLFDIAKQRKDDVLPCELKDFNFGFMMPIDLSLTGEKQ
jgi:dTDP-4-dehydrorhamnose reductase